MRKQYIIIILITILIMIFSVCSKHDSNPVAVQSDITKELLDKQSLLLENNFDILAKQIAISLSEQSMVEFIIKETSDANTRENILDFSELLSKSVNGVTFLRKITSELLKNNVNLPRLLSDDEICQVIEKFEFGLDVYFPVAAHRDKLPTQKDKLLVAVPPLFIKDDLWTVVTAYNINGETKSLDAIVPPEEPVLVIIPCEHGGEHSIISTDSDLVIRKELSPSGDGNEHEYGMVEILYKIKIHDDHEPWIKGKPEIYASWGFEMPTNNYGKYWMNSGSKDVNEEGKWYTINGNLFRWYSEYGSVFAMQIFESDGGSNKLGVTINGKKFAIEWEDDDDSLGRTIINFQDPWDDRYDTGDAEWYMRFEW